MKKLIALILCLAMVTVLFVGCANDTESNSDPAPSSENTNANTNTNTENDKLAGQAQLFPFLFPGFRAESVCGGVDRIM